MSTYVLAVRREFREAVPADWQARVRATSGVSAGESASPHRMQIEADAESLDLLRAEFGGWLHIEPAARRERLE
ncbi:MAG: hypothetical protein ABIU84_15275 [Thermoanaerobaculia bacterium]